MKKSETKNSIKTISKYIFLIIYILTGCLFHNIAALAAAVLILGFVVLFFEYRVKELFVSGGAMLALTFLVSLIIFAVSRKVETASVFMLIAACDILMTVLMIKTSILDGLVFSRHMQAATVKNLALLIDFLPQIRRERKRILTAEVARGVDVMGMSFPKKVLNEMIIAVPVIKSTCIKLKRCSKAMDDKCYDSLVRRVSIRQEIENSDGWILVGIGVLYFAVSVFFEIKIRMGS